MADRSDIEWTDATWTPIRAKHKQTGKVGWHCTHATPGCVHCYAEGMNRRLGTGLPFKPGHAGEIDLFLDEAMLLAPLRWKKPRRVFVCSMTDLFADFVPDEWIDKVFAVMALTPQHTYQVLTKRSARMRAYFGALAGTYPDGWPKNEAHYRVWQQMGRVDQLGLGCKAPPWPLPNVWLGVSAEDQRRADERIPDLLATPAAIRFVSAEPLLGPIRFSWTSEDRTHCRDYLTGDVGQMFPDGPDFDQGPKLDWIIVGGESGREARPMHPDWARQIRDQCAAAGTAFFFKQWGEWLFETQIEDGQHPGNRFFNRDGNPIDEKPPFGPPTGRLWHWWEPKHHTSIRLGKKRAGRLLDGARHDAMPERPR